MPSKEMFEALNEQIKHEFDSAYVYLSMVAYFEEMSLPGMATWMKLQSQEEVGHAMRIFDYVNDCGGRVILHPLEGPPATYASPLDAFEQALKHEQKISGLIHKLYERALNEKNYPTQIMLQWFIDEQVEEEKITGDAVAQLKRVGDSTAALLDMDNRFGQRHVEE